MRSLALFFFFAIFATMPLSAAEFRQIAMIEVPGAPGFDGLAFANGMLLIGHGGAGTVEVFDPQRRRVVAQIKAMGEVKGIAVDERAGMFYVADARSKKIAVISEKDWKVGQTVSLQHEPYDLALSSDGSTLFVANWREQSVSTLDVVHGFKVKTVEIGGSPHSLIFDPEAHLVYASLEDRSELVALDANLNVVRHIKLIASQPTGLALDGSARRLYVAVRHAVIAVQLETGTEVGRVAAPAGASSLWLDRGSGTLFVGSADGTITLIRATTSAFESLGDVRTDVRGSSLAYDAVGGFLFVPGGFEGKSKLLIMKRVEHSKESQADTTSPR